jgi:hypothetical protein
MTDSLPDFDANETAAHESAGEATELTGKELRGTLEAWQLLPWLQRKENVAVCDPTPPETDKLSAILEQRSSFNSTYAATFRVKGDQDIPSKVLEAVQHEHMPQFTLRNIGRAEKHVDLEDPLPFERKTGIGHSDYGLLNEVRTARLPKPEMAQVWSVDYSQRVRAQFRRLLLEDPWELKYGAEVKANHSGPMHSFIIEGTHPDDALGADWGPETSQPPDDWQGRSIDSDENVATFHDIRNKITGASD